MAALVRHGARRFGGSMMQRTQAAFTSPAVAEERRRIVPRLMHTEQHACARPAAHHKADAMLCSMRWQVPRLMHTEQHACARPAVHHKADAMPEIQQKKEELYDVLSRVEKNFMTNSLRNRLLLQHLAAHVNPRPQDNLWRRLRVSKRVNNFIETTGIAGIVLFSCMFAVHSVGAEEQKAALTSEKQEQ